jgi:hypothetical protein
VVVFLFLEVQIMDEFCSEDIKELASAMLKVQAVINPAIKDAQPILSLKAVTQPSTRS